MQNTSLTHGPLNNRQWIDWIWLTGCNLLIPVLENNFTFLFSTQMSIFSSSLSANDLSFFSLSNLERTTIDYHLYPFNCICVLISWLLSCYMSISGKDQPLIPRLTHSKISLQQFSLLPPHYQYFPLYWIFLSA